MSRSVPDATRFTATSIHASSKPSPAPSSSSTFSPSKSPPASSQPFQRSTKPSQPLRIPRQGNLNPSPPPPSPARTETPAQKVARLRAERNAKLMAEVTLWDRIVFKGRIVADKAHYVTVLGLMVFSVLSIGITVYALGDMIVYNRRKRKAYFIDQARERQNTLVAAITNEKAGLPLSEEQAIIMNQERMRFNNEEARLRRKRERWEYLNVRRWLVSGLKSDEEQVDQPVVESDVQSATTETTGSRPQEFSEPEPEPAGREGGVLAAVEDARRTGEKQLEAEGVKSSALDRMAARAAELGKGKSWWGWGSGK